MLYEPAIISIGLIIMIGRLLVYVIRAMPFSQLFSKKLVPDTVNE